MIRLFLAVVIFVVSGSFVRAQSNEFFRVVTSNGIPVITDYSPSGTLSWTNSTNQGRFLIERSFSVPAGEWAPIARGAFTSSQWSLKVQDPTPPPGMVYIPGGQCTIGDTFEDLPNTSSPVHQAVISPFFMEIYETTNQQLRDVYQWAYEQGLITVITNWVVNLEGTPEPLLALSPSFPEIIFSNNVFVVKAGRGNYPACYVTWFGAAAYCNYLNLREGKPLPYNLTNWTCDFNLKSYRLPTESEWELAARGGHEVMRYPWGDTNVITHSRANYRSRTNNVYDVSPTRDFHPDYANTRPRSSPVGTFAPNNFGLYDMAGNVWEWAWDWSAKYPSGTLYDPTGPATGTFRIFRGGSWFTTAERLVNAARYRSAPPEDSVEDVGFRVVLPYRQ